MLHCFVSLLSLTSYKKKMFFAGRKCYSFNTQFSVFTGDCMPLLYSMCVCVKRKFQFVTGGNWKSSKRHASLYSIVFGSLKSLPCIFCTNQTKQNVTFERKSQRTTSTTTAKHFNAEIHFLIQTGLIIFVFLPFKQLISS